MNDINELMAEVRALREEVAELRARPAAPRASSRREVLRKVAVTAGAAAAGVAVLPRGAGAADGESIKAGLITTASSTTELKLPGPPNTPASVFSHVLAVQDGVWSSPRIPFAESVAETGNSSGVGSLVGGVVMHGGYFQTNHVLRGSSGVKAHGESPGSYGIQASGRRAALRLRRLELQIPPSDRADSHNEGEILIDDNSDLWYCVTGGTPGRWLKLAGPAAAGQFHAITPARAYDSRYTPAVDAGVGPIAQSTSRTVSVANAFIPDSAQPSTADIVPAGATAVAYNLTVANTGSSGFLSINPGGTAAYAASTINWSSPGTVLANAAVVSIDGNRQVKVFCVGSPTDFIIDITGYYR